VTFLAQSHNTPLKYAAVRADNSTARHHHMIQGFLSRCASEKGAKFMAVMKFSKEDREAVKSFLREETLSLVAQTKSRDTTASKSTGKAPKRVDIKQRAKPVPPTKKA
jgi:hypothetical protein